MTDSTTTHNNEVVTHVSMTESLQSRVKFELTNDWRSFPNCSSLIPHRELDDREQFEGVDSETGLLMVIQVVGIKWRY